MMSTKHGRWHHAGEAKNVRKGHIYKIKYWWRPKYQLWQTLKFIRICRIFV